jgi:hypothetical protein
MRLKYYCVSFGHPVKEITEFICLETLDIGNSHASWALV